MGRERKKNGERDTDRAKFCRFRARRKEEEDDCDSLSVRPSVHPSLEGEFSGAMRTAEEGEGAIPDGVDGAFIRGTRCLGIRH